jgi:hypothetical protein
MQTLPNISPAANADSFNASGAMTFAGTPEKAGEPFHDLMTRALSPASKESNVDDDNSLPPKNPKSSAQPSDKNHPKTASDKADASANSSTPPETNTAAITPENVLIQIVAPILPQAEVSVADSKTAGAGNSAGIFEIFPGVKPQIQPGTKTNPEIKTAGPGKITAAVEALTVEKTNSMDSKISGPATANSQTSPLPKDASDALATAKLADKSFVPSAQPEFSASPDLKEKVAAQAESDANGTSVAQQDVPMKKMEKTDKITSSAGKILPGASVSVARADNFPSRENFSAAALSRAGQNAANITANSSASNNANDAAPVSADAANAILNGNLAEVRSRALERAQDIIVLHADRLSESGNPSLQVVIKPGAGTQLSLELRQRGDGVEAQAVLQRGDFNHLNQQWPALQQQLEQRGIRLAPLITDGNFASGGENNFQHNQNQSAESDLFPAGAFAEVAPASPFAPTATHAGTHRGWESWA